MINTTCVTRRDLLKSAACGFGSLALAGTLTDAAAADSSPLAARQPHLVPRAKRAIFIFMQGGPSQVDTFDEKTSLVKHDGQKIDFDVARTRQRSAEAVLRSPWKFRNHGQCGQRVSELFPHMARHVDDFCLIRSMHTEGVAHGPATLFLHTGATNLIRPSVGGWISYGLGTENQNLPAFVTINPPPTKGGPRNYSNAFLPTAYQGTVIRHSGTGGLASVDPIKHLTSSHDDPARQYRQLALLNDINRHQAAAAGHDDRLEATIRSYELAFRMQSHVPGIVNLAKEPEHIRQMYGVGEKDTDGFARQCIMARQLAEAGVRYIQVSYSDTKDTPKWDQHSNLKEHEIHARNTDKPVAGLLQDLKQRGLLDDTLVWWGGEFGRTPFAQNRDGRDHNPLGFTVWLAGGGVKRGFAFGQTDEFGYKAVENKVHMHDLHATILQLLGIDHQRLTYRYAGRDFRLTDVHGRVVHDIIA